MEFPPLEVLVVDDEEAMRTVLESRLGAWGLEVLSAPDLASAERAMEKFEPRIVVTDVMLSDGSGVELLDRLRELELDIPVILITAHGTVDLAVDAMKKGALDFLTKPLDYDRLGRALEAAQASLRSRQRTHEIPDDVESAEHLGELVGSSRAMREVFAVMAEIAPTDASILLTGESGTGKELAARTLHALSRRREQAFVAINSAAIPKELMESEIFGHEKGSFTGATGTRRGCFELADGGTLLLDEIAEMPISLQPKLLRVLEDGRVRRIGAPRELEVDVRVLAATNRPPGEAIERGLLREDLYFRLNVFEIELPPLRRRREDIPLLIEHFLEGLNARHDTAVEGLSDEALGRLEEHAWPGNVRELRNVIERAVVLAKEGEIDVSHLPRTLGGEATVRTSDSSSPTVEIPVGTTVADAEKELILRTLDETGNNKAEAARRLEIDVKTIRNKLKAWGIDR
ncbi:MAG: sigma-54 dependent transcriptional regulator [Thermoanaerobaculia bacterium]|nr:sigma-54 dependent transcriptional regulator [Thermoanaerobaculia bacterium]